VNTRETPLSASKDSNTKDQGDPFNVPSTQIADERPGNGLQYDEAWMSWPARTPL
jgi:hypothetical protein